MDFKIAGTQNGVTAIQLDIKPAGIPLDIICECLQPARKGRLQILAHMEREINAPRTQNDRNSPQLGKNLIMVSNMTCCSMILIHNLQNYLCYGFEAINF